MALSRNCHKQWREQLLVSARFAYIKPKLTQEWDGVLKPYVNGSGGKRSALITGEGKKQPKTTILQLLS